MHGEEAEGAAPGVGGRIVVEVIGPGVAVEAVACIGVANDLGLDG